MSALTERQSTLITDLCRRYRVERLELFGSATGEDFDPESSDFDFLVDFLPLERGTRADTYFGLLEGLEELLGRPVDLVMTTAIRNPYFLEAVAAQREVLYAA